MLLYYYLVLKFSNNVVNFILMVFLWCVCRCFEEHKKLQESLEKQQDRVSSLQNMVVIVEDGVQDPGMHAIYIYDTGGADSPQQYVKLPMRNQG